MESKQLIGPTAVKTKDQKAAFEYYAPQAEKVCLSGSFNGWDLKACPLKKDKEGYWRTTLLLTPGRYEYRYLVDGGWENDQRPGEAVPNAFGTWNCVVTINEK